MLAASAAEEIKEKERKKTTIRQDAVREKLGIKKNNLFDLFYRAG